MYASKISALLYNFCVADFKQIIKRRPSQWWLWWPLLGLHRYCHLLLICCRVSGRNGVHVCRSLYFSLASSEIGNKSCHISLNSEPSSRHAHGTIRAPTSGGQYHWVSEFAPPEYQKVASYAAGLSSLILCPECTRAKHHIGWMSTLGWLASVASSVFVVATLIEVLIDVTNPSFAFPNWQYTLIMLAALVLTIFLNTWGARVLPMLETISLFGHIGGFFITLIPLWVLAPKNPAHAVFAEVVNNGGWRNTGTSCLIAQVTVLYCNLGKLQLSLEREFQSANITQVPTVPYISVNDAPA